MKLKHLIHDRDRHGSDRYYVRLPGCKKLRIRAAPLSQEFMDEYHDAISGAVASKKQAAAAKAGSFRSLCSQYFDGAKFKANDESTQNWQRRTLESIAEKHGAKPVAMMASRHVRKIRNEKTRAAANQRMKAMRAMFSWANEEEISPHNPTVGVKNIKYKTKGHHTWTDEEVIQYYERHPLGSQARLGIDLIRFTTGRREDAPRFGKQHTQNGRVKFRQGKNEDRAPVDINIPIHPLLAESIAATKTGNLTFLITRWGKPFTTNGFGNKFKDWCRQAGLPHCSAHGVRKYTATALAQKMATPHMIKSVTGHQSLKEVENYTRDVDNARLADEAMALIK